MKTSIETYKKAYNRMIEDKEGIIITNDGTIKMSFEEYLEYARKRIERQNKFNRGYR